MQRRYIGKNERPLEITIGGSAKISGNKASGTYSYGGAVYAENAAITMTGGTIENNGAQNGGNELFLIGSTTFTMRGGKLRHTIDAAAWRTVSLRSSAKLSISDGEIELLNEPYAMELRDTAKLTATGGTVIASGTIAAFDLVSTADVDPKGGDLRRCGRRNGGIHHLSESHPHMRAAST